MLIQIPDEAVVFHKFACVHMHRARARARARWQPLQ